MRIETFRKIYNLRNGLIVLGVFHLIATVLLILLVDKVRIWDGFALASLFDMLFFIILIPVLEIISHKILKNTIKEDRQLNKPEYRYEYDDFNGDYWTIVTRLSRYSVHEPWEIKYNLINREGQLFFHTFYDKIYRRIVPQGLTGFGVIYQDNPQFCNLLICDGYMHKDISFLVDQDVKGVSNFDSDGLARVTFLDDSVNYVDIKGKLLYPQNLIGYQNTKDFEN